ncbi:LysR family transcriptional regulator [Thermomonas brevis]
MGIRGDAVNLPELAAFVAVAEHGGFSLAAEQLHLSQPAVSKRIALLEGQLGVRLFDRIGRQVLPTEAGRVLLPRARQLLAEAEAARRAVQDMGDAVGGRLSLVTSHHIGLHRLPGVLRDFSRLHPDAALDIRFMDSEAAWDEVLQGQAELALTTLGEAAPPLLAAAVWHDPLQVVVAPDHPLAARRRLKPADLVAHAAVLPDARTVTHRIVAEALARHGHALRLRMTTNHMETLKMLASVGLAWTVLPATMVDGSLRVLQVDGLKLSRRLGSVVHGGRTPSRAARAFLELLRAAADPR